MNCLMIFTLVFSETLASETINTTPTPTTDYSLIEAQNYNKCLVEKTPENDKQEPQN